MTKTIKWKRLNVALIVLGLLGATSCRPNRNSQSVNIDEPAMIKSQIERYRNSINAADAKQGAALFSQGSEVSFIHPRGHEHGWAAIEKDIYGMFAETFVKRDLKTSDERVSVYGDTAWAEFYWVFDAVMKDNTPLQTKGRETQIWKKEGTEWRLIHVHYSGLPVTASRQGF
jgi:ketosteroid isomerase-like protein